MLNRYRLIAASSGTLGQLWYHSLKRAFREIHPNLAFSYKYVTIRTKINVTSSRARLPWLLACFSLNHLSNGSVTVPLMRMADFLSRQKFFYQSTSIQENLLVSSLNSLFKMSKQNIIGSRENEGTERDFEGVGRDMSIPLKLFLEMRTSTETYFRLWKNH